MSGAGTECSVCGGRPALSCICAPCAARALANSLDMISSNVCTLLGPTMHYVSFDAASIALGKLGWLVFSVGSHRMSDLGLGTTDEERRVYWRTHREKMDVSSMAFVVDMPTPTAPMSMRRVGKDTEAEIAYARQNGLRVVRMGDVWPSRLPVPQKSGDGGGNGGRGQGGAGSG